MDSVDSYKECECGTCIQARQRVREWLHNQHEEMEDWIREKEKEEGKEIAELQQRDKMKYYQMWERLSYSLMYLLRDYLPWKKNAKIEAGGG